MLNKTDFRIIAKNKRKDLNINVISTKITAKVRNSHWYLNANNIMLFYPKENEINLLDLLKDKKSFFFPKTVDDNLLPCPNCDEFYTGKFNIKEPQSEPVDKNLIDVVIIPALMADEKKYRLGYGGGYYDRFLKDFYGLKICVVAKDLLIDELPIEEFDIPCDIIITD